ncbi:class I SAM-dependent methyltransferase [Nocardia sp. NPDC058176]|uniref:class I SAM-dependent methyltransferase n=1 Tax=Nocardia sp. NPDC058176 TaxID=3346368 RepID=UPI0036DC4FB7
MAELFDYDAELRRYHRRLLDEMFVSPDDHVLDIGCGAGQTTRAAAGLAVRGSALGVDVSPAMVARARRLSADEGLRNVRFEEADAQVHPFAPAHFTVGISRFGTMFFADPIAAFTHIGRALAPGGRFVQLVWQDSRRQEWATAIHHALVGDDSPVPRATEKPFSLADPATVHGILTTAGFTDIQIIDVREPICLATDPEVAVDTVRVLRMVGDELARLDADGTERALERLREVMAAHSTGDGVWFDSRAWLITAHR